MSWRTALLVATGTALVIAALFADPFPQDPAYHLFADDRRMLGIPNFMNVFSNLGFLAVGIYAFVLLDRMTPSALLPAWVMLAVGIVATALGSGYYHWAPTNETLAWDRLGMAIGFMSLTALVIGEYGSPKIGRAMLAPLIALGIVSVVYWSQSEALGRGDLRLYAIVQFMPALLIPLTLLLYPRRSDLTRSLWWLFACYLLAKVSEHFDSQIYEMGGLISGHSLKHLFAAVGLLFLFVGLRRRLS